jgi:uncharacterized protein (TIGR00725 family)
MGKGNKIIAVIGSGHCDQRIYTLAQDVGKQLAEKGFVIICGGLGGVMEAACRGAKDAGGLTIGILPSDDPHDSNSFVDIPIATGMGIGRNIIIVRSAQAIVAVNGSYGTLSELAFAMQLNKPVVGLETWDVSDRIVKTSNPKETVNKILELVNAV